VTFIPAFGSFGMSANVVATETSKPFVRYLVRGWQTRRSNGVTLNAGEFEYSNLGDFSVRAPYQRGDTAMQVSVSGSVTSMSLDTCDIYLVKNACISGDVMTKNEEVFHVGRVKCGVAPTFFSMCHLVSPMQVGDKLAIFIATHHGTPITVVDAGVTMHTLY